MIRSLGKNDLYCWNAYRDLWDDAASSHGVFRSKNSHPVLHGTPSTQDLPERSV